jgi:uncharacterized protein YutE (UPF0331/DUF86 family)
MTHQERVLQQLVQQGNLSEKEARKFKRMNKWKNRRKKEGRWK